MDWQLPPNPFAAPGRQHFPEMSALFEHAVEDEDERSAHEWSIDEIAQLFPCKLSPIVAKTAPRRGSAISSTPAPPPTEVSTCRTSAAAPPSGVDESSWGSEEASKGVMTCTPWKGQKKLPEMIEISPIAPYVSRHAHFHE